jgi:hypothetical protein
VAAQAENKTAQKARVPHNLPPKPTFFEPSYFTNCSTDRLERRLIEALKQADYIAIGNDPD